MRVVVTDCRAIVDRFAVDRDRHITVRMKGISVRPWTTPYMYERILVATDGSEAANRALEQALDLASTFDAELHAIAAVDTRRYGDSMLADSADVVDDLREYATELLTDVHSRGRRRHDRTASRSSTESDR